MLSSCGIIVVSMTSADQSVDRFEYLMSVIASLQRSSAKPDTFTQNGTVIST